jgi:hydroxyacylglutathione hydrolase
MSQFIAFLSAKANPNFPEVQDIEPQDLWAHRDKVTIIDVRRDDERVTGYVPGSRHIVLDTLPDHTDQIPKDQSLVFVCRSGGRSARASAWALSEGFKSVYNLRGGMLLWEQLNLESTK